MRRGDWDLKICLPRQLKNSNIFPDSGDYEPFRYINIKREFHKFYKTECPFGMKGMLDYLNLNLEGHHHSGIDDCKNIKRILQKMITDGYCFV